MVRSTPHSRLGRAQADQSPVEVDRSLASEPFPPHVPVDGGPEAVSASSTAACRSARTTRQPSWRPPLIACRLIQVRRQMRRLERYMTEHPTNLAGARDIYHSYLRARSAVPDSEWLSRDNARLARIKPL